MENQTLERFHALSTTHFCDAEANIKVMDHSIKPLIIANKMIGRAHTVKCDGDLLSIIEAFESIKANSVLVIEAGNSPHAVFGEILSTVAKNKGVSGVVIDGYCRDLVDIKKLGISLYAKGVHPKVGTKIKFGTVHGEILCGGITVRQHDIIFGDENGIVVFEEKQLDDLLDRALQIKQREENILLKIRSGSALNDVLNFDEHRRRILAGDLSSQLGWKE